MDRIDTLIAKLKYATGLQRLFLISTLGSFRDPKTIEPLISLFSLRGFFTGWAATNALSRIAAALPIDPFLDALKDTDSYVRKGVANVLGKAGWKPSNISERAFYLAAKQAWSKLPFLGEKAIEPLIIAMQDDNASIRKKAGNTLSKIRSGNIGDILFKAIKHQNHKIRAEAAKVLEKTGWKPSNSMERAYYHVARQEWRSLAALGKDAVEPLVIAQKDEDVVLRKNAVEALGRTRHLSAVEPLANALKDNNVRIRRAAVESLFKIGFSNKGDPAPVIHLISATRDIHHFVFERAEEVLKTLSTSALETLIDALKHKDPEIRIEAAKILGQIGGAPAVEPLILALKDENVDVRLEAARALGHIKNAGALEPLIRTLTDNYNEVRTEAAKALGNIKDTRAVKPLILALDQSYAALQIEAAAALGKIGDLEAVERLHHKVKHAPAWPAWNKAVLALGRLGDVRAVDYLLSIEGLDAEEANIIVKKICSLTPSQGHKLICKKCFCRAGEHKPKPPSFSQISEDVAVVFKHMKMTYYACRMCHGNSRLLGGIKTVILLLDHDFEKFSVKNEMDGAVLTVNWFKRKEPFDYDEIHIKDADDFEVEKLVLKLRNDMDDERRKRLPDTPVYLSPGLTLSTAKMNLLKDNFPGKINISTVG